MTLLEQPRRIQDLVKRHVIRPRHVRALALLEATEAAAHQLERYATKAQTVERYAEGWVAF